MEKVTVCIQTYNLEKYISQCIESILAQKTNFDFKIRVVDDASTDDTTSILKKYKERYPNKFDIEFLKQNYGSTISGNILFSKINTPYFCFIDGDDYYYNDSKLQKQFDFLEMNSEYSMVGGQTFYLRDNKLSDFVISKEKLNKSYTFDDVLQDKFPFTHTSSLMYRNIVFNSGIPRDFLKNENTIYKDCFRGEMPRFYMHIRKGKIFLLDEVFSVYRIHEKGIFSGSSEYTRDLLSCLQALKFSEVIPEAEKFFWGKFYKSFLHILYMLKTKVNLSKENLAVLINILSEINKYKINLDLLNQQYDKKVVEKVVERIIVSQEFFPKPAKKRIKKIKNKIYYKLFKHFKKKVLVQHVEKNEMKFIDK